MPTDKSIGSTKFQGPNPREAPIPNLQIMYSRGGQMFGIWDLRFPGAWRLGFGASGCFATGSCHQWG